MIMPSNWPPDSTTGTTATAATATIPHIRLVALAAGFFTVLALLLIAGSFVPVAPPI
jgi:hypothetical protein